LGADTAMNTLPAAIPDRFTLWRVDKHSPSN